LLIRADFMQEVIGWASRCPCPQESGKPGIEIRQLFEAEDYGEELTPELRAKEERLRAGSPTSGRPAGADGTGAAPSPARGRRPDQGLRAARPPTSDLVRTPPAVVRPFARARLY
jgi:hypothetical protein